MVTLLALLLISSGLPDQLALDQSVQQGRLSLVMLNSRGEPVKGTVQISVSRLDRQGARQPRFSIGPNSTLPYGRYHLRVEGSPAYPVEKTIVIHEPEQVVIVGLFIAPIELPAPSNIIRGSVSAPNVKRGCRWVRLISPVSEREFKDLRVFDSGRFTASDVKPGQYLVVLLGEQGICSVTQTSITGEPLQDLAPL